MKKNEKKVPVKQKDLYLVFVTESPVNGDPYYKLVAAHDSLDVVKFIISQMKVSADVFHYTLVEP